MKLLLSILLFLPIISFAQSRDSVIANDPWIEPVLDSCNITQHTIEFVNKANTPNGIKKYIKRHKHAMLYGYKAFDTPGKPAYIVLVYAVGYVMDVIEYYYFNSKLKFVKSGTYFCDVCF